MSQNNIPVPGRSSCPSSPLSTFISNLKLGLVTVWILLCGSICFLILSPIFIYRWILIQLCSILKPFTHILAPQSHYFMTGSSSTSSSSNVQTAIWGNVLLQLKIKGTLDFETFKHTFLNRIIYAINDKKRNGSSKWLYPELQQTCEKWGGFYFWKQEENFSIHSHILLHDSQKNLKNERKTTLADIQDEYLKTELSLDKSPWEILLVENEGDNNDEEPWFLVLFKFHHVLGDGQAIFSALSRWFDESPLQPPSFSGPSIVSRLLYCTTLPFSFAFQIAKLLNHNNSVECLSDDWENLPMDLSSIKSKQEVNSLASVLKLERVKCIAKKYSVSFTTVLLTAITGGLRNLFLKELKGGRIPADILCTLPVPDPKHPDGLVNSVCLVCLKLPIGSANFLDRLNLIESRFKEKKQNHIEQLIIYFMTLLAGYLPRFIYNQLQSSSSCLIPISLSLVPGSLKPVAVNGQELFDMSFTVLSTLNFANVRMLTYGNQITITPTGDHRLFSSQDISELLEWIVNEFNVMENNAGIKEEIRNGVNVQTSISMNI